MNDFLNRITVQREVINIVNKQQQFFFPLSSLSSKSIERWQKENSIVDDSKLLKMIREISEKLFFLANKSQEQITEEYRLLSRTISELINNLKVSVKNYKSNPL